MKATMWIMAVILTCCWNECSSCNSSPTAAPATIAPRPPETTYDECVDCICQVESNCRMPNPLCHWDVGSDSCGPYQIKFNYWLDARLRGGHLMGAWQTCAASFQCSRAAVRGYMDRYATTARLGREPTCEDWARIHNGGPIGYRKDSTLAYWRRVQNCL